MCRFTFYYGKPMQLKSLVSDPEHSLIHQSFNSKERKEPLNGDGFGVGWYADQDPEPAIFKSTTPAWNNNNLNDLSRVIKSHCMLAHVRATTFGFDIAKMNCHPFKIDNFMFCHNGQIEGFGKIKKELITLLDDEILAQVYGTTDSEYFFALIIKCLQNFKNKHSINNMAKAVNNAIKLLNQLIKRYAPEGFANLNCALTDGKNTIITRYTSRRDRDPDSLYICHEMELCCQNGSCSMRKTKSKKHQCVLVGSEPLCSNGDWRKVKSSCLLLINEDQEVKEMIIKV